MLPGYASIDTVGDEQEQTHAHVPQRAMVVPVGLQTRALVQLLEEQTGGGRPYKIILFFATARQTAYYSEVLQTCGFNVLEMHSRKSQPYRNRVSDDFRKGTNMILASSDVSAR